MADQLERSFIVTRFIRLPEVRAMTDLSRTMIYRLQQEGLFPRSVKLTNYAVGWVDAEVAAGVAERSAAPSRRAMRSAAPSADQELDSGGDGGTRPRSSASF